MSLLPVICTMPVRSKRGANRAANAAIRAYKERFAGGGAFGWDWPTLRLNEPETYDYLQALKAQYAGLPS